MVAGAVQEDDIARSALSPKGHPKKPPTGLPNNCLRAFLYESGEASSGHAPPMDVPNRYPDEYPNEYPNESDFREQVSTVSLSQGRLNQGLIQGYRASFSRFLACSAQPRGSRELADRAAKCDGKQRVVSAVMHAPTSTGSQLSVWSLTLCSSSRLCFENKRKITGDLQPALKSGITNYGNSCSSLLSVDTTRPLARHPVDHL